MTMFLSLASVLNDLFISLLLKRRRYYQTHIYVFFFTVELWENKACLKLILRFMLLVSSVKALRSVFINQRQSLKASIIAVVLSAEFGFLHLCTRLRIFSAISQIHLQG